MYSSYYAECSKLAGDVGRNHETLAIDQVVAGLEKAKEYGLQSTYGMAALHDTLMVWSFLLEDLADSDNDLPDQLRADLISIGIFVVKEVEQIRLAQSDDIETLIEINTAIRNGLAQ